MNSSKSGDTVSAASSGYGSAYAVNGACWGFPDRDKEYPGKHKCSVRNKTLRF
jgi:hypothetical protein